MGPDAMWITPYLLMSMAYGAWMVRSRQTSKTCSISASWCHTFEHLSPDSPPPWSFSLGFSHSTSQSSYDHPRCTATCCKLRPLRSEGEEESMSGVPLARKSWCPCIINSILTDKAKWNTEIFTYATQRGCKGHVPLRDMQREFTMRSADTETAHDIAASQLQQLISPHQALLSFIPLLPSFAELFKVQGHPRMYWPRQLRMSYCSILWHCPSHDLVLLKIKNKISCPSWARKWPQVLVHSRQ